jgi:hypothetical protein
MADERNREPRASDDREQDGLGRDAAHGGGPDATTGGSYGRSTGRAGERDLFEVSEGSGGTRGDRDASRPVDASDDATRHQREAGLRRRGLPDKGFDAGTGYGGGGNASAYRAKSSYGGQSAMGGSTMRGAYSGEGYGSLVEPDVQTGTPPGAEIPRGTDEQSPESGRDDGRRRRASDRTDDDAVDLDVTPDVSRRDPTR